MAARPHPRLTPEEYLEFERASETKHEYHNGFMWPLHGYGKAGYGMAGGSSNQAIICGNVIRELGTSLKRRPCIVTGSDLRIRITPEGTYLYPDVAVVCGEPKYADQRRDSLLNPVLIIEVLSPSTEAYDRGFKAQQYRKLESLREYALVSQSEARVEIVRRHPDGTWVLSEVAGLDATCRFEGIECSLQLAEIYDKVTFGPEEPPLRPPEI